MWYERSKRKIISLDITIKSHYDEHSVLYTAIQSDI